MEYNPDPNKMTYYDFIIIKEHNFLRNIYDPYVLTKSKNIKNIRNFYNAFRFFVRVAFILYDFYDKQSNIIFINHEPIYELINDYCQDLDSFSYLFKKIYDISIKNLGRKINKRLCQVIDFVCIKIMQFPSEQFFAPSIVTKNFFSNVINIMDGKSLLHVLMWQEQFAVIGIVFTN